MKTIELILEAAAIALLWILLIPVTSFWVSMLLLTVLAIIVVRLWKR